MKQSVFYISDLCCPSEEQLIRNRLRAIQGVDRLDFNLMQRELTVTHRLDDDRNILVALDSLGMGAQLKTADVEPTDHDHPTVVPTTTWVLMGLSGVAAVAAEIVAWTTRQETAPAVIALALLSIVAGGRDTLRKGLVALRAFTLNINFLMTIAVIGAAFIGQWPEAAMVTFLFGLAEMIEEFSLERARHAIGSLLTMTPETAWVQDGQGQWRAVEAATVQVGQNVRVKPGERIPLDGTVIAGQSAVNQAPITGESIPVDKAAGDPVFAGSVNERGSFDFTVTANKGHTTLDRIIRAVQEAQAQRAPTQRFIDQFARYYTPGVVGIAVLIALVPPLAFGAPFHAWFYKALVMLVIACPCALVISTPVTVVSGLAAAARRGILVKGGVYLEEGRRLKMVALDKTGTLTSGTPVVTDVVSLNDQPADTLLQLAASLEAHSEHPVASAVVARQRPGELLSVTNFESLTGRGVKGTINGQVYYVGNHRLAEEIGVCGPHVEAVLERLEQEGKTAVVLSSERAALAVLGIADTLRETSVAALQELHQLGLRTVMLTGDNQTTAQVIATKVGIDDARGNLLPEDKLAVVSDLLGRYGKVGMVGDGINDAPALAKASIGFAMGAAGTDTALETADVALMEDDLRKLSLFIHLSRQTSRILAQNITLAIGIKLVFFLLALMGRATLWMAVFADLGASLLVVFNGLRLLRKSRG
ncbi:MAG: cadmium-translocating P-type ATPase [Armatimonadota bacterium]|nr:cadmium-translocating P-type ATPase [Armatimonadota bacterium]